MLPYVNTYIIKSNGLITDPCGTPCVHASVFEHLLPVTNFDFYYMNNFLPIVRLHNILICQVKLYGLLCQKPCANQYTILVLSDLSIPEERSVISLKTACIVLLFFLKP